MYQSPPRIDIAMVAIELVNGRTELELELELEHELAGTEVLHLIDVSGDHNNRVTYRIDDPEMKKLFHINPVTGMITIKAEIEGEVNVLTIIAQKGFST